MEQRKGCLGRQKPSAFAGGGGKASARLIWRGMLVLAVLGTALILALCGLLAGLGGFMIRPQNSFISQPSLHNIPNAARRCDGRRLYIYDLPPLFNVQIIDAYCNNKTFFPEMCAAAMNEGMGFKLENVIEPMQAWYRTHQYVLEVLFHHRIKHYECITHDPDAADLFYAPYYAALDVNQYLFSPEIQLRDKLSQRFLGWLMAQSPWNRLHGHKHFMVLGRIVWDFSRSEEDSTSWGSSLLSAWEFGNMTTFLIERDPLAGDRQIAVPYPTSFHPGSDFELKLWQEKVSASKRDIFVSFAGAPRNSSHFDAVLRHTLFHQCSQSARCSPLLCSEIDCPRNPHLVTEFLLRSVFCLQPPGDSPTRRAVFDCLVAGTIPVFFSVHTAYSQYAWHLPADGDSYSVLIDEQEVVDGRCDVIAALERIPASRIAKMRDTIVNEILPIIVYDLPSRHPHKKTRDAIDVILDKILVPGFRPFPPHPPA